MKENTDVSAVLVASGFLQNFVFLKIMGRMNELPFVTLYSKVYAFRNNIDTLVMDVLQPVTPICVHYDSDARSVASESTISSNRSKGKNTSSKKIGKTKLLKSKTKKKISSNSNTNKVVSFSVNDSVQSRKSYFSCIRNFSCTYLSTFFYNKYSNSKLYEFYHGTCLVEDVDVSMNTAIFINGILMSIPFGLSTSMSYDYWDWLNASVYKCFSDILSDDEKVHFLRYMELEIKSSLSASLFSATIGVLLSIIYFLFRPRGVLFHSWFKRAKYSITLIFMISAFSIISVFICAAMNIRYYNQSSVSICHELNRQYRNNGKKN